jgi:VWFA-related protein
MNAGRTPSILLYIWVLASCLGLAAQQSPENPPHDDNFVLKSDVNVVVVPVVVRDARGQEVGTLKKENFRVFDNGKSQVISGFSVHQGGQAGTSTKDAVSPSTSLGVNPRPATAPERFIVFVFDDMHLSFADLAQTQKAASLVLTGTLADTDMAAIVSTSGRVNSGITHDRGKLQEAIMKLQPHDLYRAAGSECPNIDYYQADEIENKHSETAREAAINEILSCTPNLQRDMAERLVDSAAGQALATGDQDVRVTLGAIGEFLRRMIAFPGQRTLILVSPGFLTITDEALSMESQIMDLAAQSNVTISALDARGLYTTELDASDRSRGSAHTMQLKAEYHRNSMGLAENVMAELADATGGSYFHNNNDLQTGLSYLAAGPEYLYLLYVSPKNVKQDGSFHRLKVKVDQGGLKLQARRGYFAAKPLKKKK